MAIDHLPKLSIACAAKVETPFAEDLGQPSHWLWKHQLLAWTTNGQRVSGLALASAGLIRVTSLNVWRALKGHSRSLRARATGPWSPVPSIGAGIAHRDQVDCRMAVEDLNGGPCPHQPDRASCLKALIRKFRFVLSRKQKETAS